VVPEGRVVVGEAVLFPNLFPVAQLHAVVRLGAAHDRPLAASEPAAFRDALDASLSFLRGHVEAVPAVRFVTIDGNFLPPGGASLAHPHLQIVGGDAPCGWLERVQPLARHWLETHGCCYWSSLLATERAAGERFVADTGPVGWVASFSPDGSNEVLGILPTRRHFLELDQHDVAALAAGLAAVLRGYGAMGLSTYNLAIYSAPLGASSEELCCLVRVISRQNFYENYRTDDYFLQKLLRTELILTPPERLATLLRPAFGA
jgi:galactose-1-phosphate uridylyltransferase